jgi:hypothetical protein
VVLDGQAYRTPKLPPASSKIIPGSIAPISARGSAGGAAGAPATAVPEPIRRRRALGPDGAAPFRYVTLRADDPAPIGLRRPGLLST